jgi:predicted acylesterase/phospholipase RssA
MRAGNRSNPDAPPNLNEGMTKMHTTLPRILSALFLLGGLALSACSPSRINAVPFETADHAVVMHHPEIRTWEDDLSQPFTDELWSGAKREMDIRAAANDKSPLPPADYLAISGGGANGAYGAGILCGWTAKGGRPEFKVVTGISTGALTAPFAFLGPAYDDKLKTVYTTVTTKEICTSRGLSGALFNDALMDTEPLHKLLDKLLDDKMIDDITHEYNKGRLLLVETTNLDSGRAVIWNIGAIAELNTPESKKLIRQILIASAAIPGAFPPVMIDVEADGKKYQEMHVDGGASAQVFLYPPSVNLKETTAGMGVHRERRAWIIRNARLDAKWAEVQRKTLSIAGRAIDSLIQTQGVGDLYRIYLTTQRDGVDYNLTYIPKTFNEKPAEDFDPVYMTKLFNVGYQAVQDGTAWIKKPPELLEADTGKSASAAK